MKRDESPIRYPQLGSISERNIRMKNERKKATQQRLMKEMSRHKILIQNTPFSMKPVRFYLNAAKSQYLRLMKSRSSGSLTSSYRKNNTSISRSSASALKSSKCEATQELQLKAFIPDWLLARPDFNEAVKAMEKEEKERLLHILDIHPRDRSEDDKLLVQSYLMNIKFFKDLSPSLLIELGNRLTKHEHKENEQIIKKGDAANCLFILYKGNAAVFIEGVKIAEKLEGDIIGEISLEFRLPRSADVVANCKCVTFKLMSSAYEAACISVKRKEKHENIEMLQGITFFQNWSLLKILKISALLNVQTFGEGTVIYERSSPAKCIYFVKDGRVDLYAYVPIEKYNKWPMGINEWRIHQVNKEYLVKVAKLTKGQYFGEAEIKDAGLRTLKAVAKNDCTCLVLNRDHFLELFSEFEIESFALMGSVKIPSSKNLQDKVIKGLNERMTTENAILDALKVNFVSLQGRESVLDPKIKKLGPWLNGYMLRRRESEQTFKQKIVFENRRNISVSKMKKNMTLIDH